MLLCFAKAQSEKGAWFESSQNGTDPPAAIVPTAANSTALAGSGDLPPVPASSSANETGTGTGAPNTVGPPEAQGAPDTSNPSEIAAAPSVAPADDAEGSEATNPPDGVISEATDMPTGDDNYDKETEGGDYEGEGEWGSVPEDEGTKAPYVPPAGDDPFAKEPDTGSKWSTAEGLSGIEKPAEMMHDKNVIAAVAVSLVFALVLALCTAQQVIENPDGCCTRYVLLLLCPFR